MKANEVPEKLYIDFRDRAESTWRCAYTEKTLANDIEYTRTDVFIEKAIEWWMDNFVYTDDVEIKYDTIQSFKNYMKGK